MKRFCLIIFVLFFSSKALSAIPHEEKILKFHSKIEILENSDLIVTETIKVVILGKKFNRGIYRDFITRRDIQLNETRVNVRNNFQVLEVLKNGKKEPYHFENVDFNKRLYIGDKKTYLSKGIYEYKITYKTNNQIDFYTDYDVLHWNATGVWDVNIDSVTAEIFLPNNARPIDLVERQDNGSRQDYEISLSKDSIFIKYNKKVVYSGDEFSFEVFWSKGNILTPGYFEIYKMEFIFLLFIILILVYYLVMWFFYGKDPKKIKGRKPPYGDVKCAPEDISPSLCSYIYNLAYVKDTVLQATIMGLAVKGYLKIKGGEDAEIVKDTESKKQEVTKIEKEILKILFQFTSKIKADTSGGLIFEDCFKFLKKEELKKIGKKYVVHNTMIFLVGFTSSVFLFF